MKITDQEYDKLIKRLEFNDTTRNNLLIFSFTVVLTFLGVALPMETNVVNAWICMLPYLLIVPFAARISYYRVSSAHISSFLRIYAKERMKFEEGAQAVKEDFGKGYGSIAWLINHEMFLLAVTCSGVFYFKFIPVVEKWGVYEHLCAIIPMLLLWLVYTVIHSTYDYTQLTSAYKTKWKKRSAKEDKRTKNRLRSMKLLKGTRVFFR